MDKNLRKFFEVFVEFYTDAGPDIVTDNLIDRYRYDIDDWYLRCWHRYVEANNGNVNDVTFDSINDLTKKNFCLPEQKIRIKLDVWFALINKLVNKLHDTENLIQALCNETTKVNYICSIEASGIDLIVWVYKEDIENGKNVNSNKYFREAKRLVLDYFHYAKSLKTDFDNYQRSINGQTYEVNKPEELDDDKEGIAITIDNYGIHGFGKGTDPDTTEFNKYLVKHAYSSTYDKMLVTN